MLNKNKQILGNLFIQYKFINKNNAYNSARKYKELSPELFEYKKPLLPSQYSSSISIDKVRRHKTDPNNQSRNDQCCDNYKIRQNRLCYSLHKSKCLGTPIKGSKGGNIIIPKAKKWQKIRYKGGSPGPGSYNIGSHFDQYKNNI